MLRVTLCLLIGVVLGSILFFGLFRVPVTSTFAWQLPTYVYKGILVTQDRERKMLTVSIPSTFAFSNGGAVRFLYDDATQWKSFEYIFHDGVSVSRSISSESTQALPPGTVLEIVADVKPGQLRAGSIAFLKRTSL